MYLGRISSPTLAIILVLAACTPAAQTTPGSTATAAPSPTAAATPSPSPEVDTVEDLAIATIEVERSPDFPTEAFGSLWVLAPDGDEPAVVRIDPATNEEVARVLLPGGCQGVGASDDAVWACTPDGAVRIDPETNTISGSVTYDSGAWFGRMAFGDGAIWAIGFDGGVPNTLIRIDPVAMDATPFPLGRPAASVGFGIGAVWVSSPIDGMLLRVDPATGDVTEHASGLPGPSTLAIGPDSIWVTLHGKQGDDPADGDATVVRIDPDDGAILAEIVTEAPSRGLGGVWAEEDAVWVRAPDAFLTEIDPATNMVVRTIPGPPSSGEVTVAFGSVWATTVEGNLVYRFEP